MKTKKEEIRKVVLAHHGGLQEATNAQIMVIFNSLPKETQEKYLSEIKEGSKKNAPGDKPQSDVRNRS